MIDELKLRIIELQEQNDELETACDELTISLVSANKEIDQLREQVAGLRELVSDAYYAGDMPFVPVWHKKAKKLLTTPGEQDDG